MDEKIFYMWYNKDTDEQGHNICIPDKFESLKNLSGREVEFRVLFTFKTNDDFICNFIINNLGTEQEAEIFLRHYNCI